MARCQVLAAQVLGCCKLQLYVSLLNIACAQKLPCIAAEPLFQPFVASHDHPRPGCFVLVTYTILVDWALKRIYQKFWLRQPQVMVENDTKACYAARSWTLRYAR